MDLSKGQLGRAGSLGLGLGAVLRRLVHPRLARNRQRQARAFGIAARLGPIFFLN